MSMLIDWSVSDIDDYWQILNIGEAQRLGSGVVDRVIDPADNDRVVGETQKCHLIFRRLLAMLRIPQLPKCQFSAGTLSSENLQSPFLALPNELIYRVTSFVTAPQSIVNLALTTPFMFRFLGPRIRQAVIDDVAPWAGKRLVVMSVEHDHFFDDKDDGHSRLDSHQYWHAYFSASVVSDSVMSGVDRPFSTTAAPLRIRSTRFLQLSDEETVRLQRLIHPTPPGWMSAAETILRNLTTREYVREPALAVYGKIPTPLGDVLSVVTRWCDGQFDYECLRSPWHGCRFDIISASPMWEAQKLAERWSDASAWVNAAMSQFNLSRRAMPPRRLLKYRDFGDHLVVE